MKNKPLKENQKNVAKLVNLHPNHKSKYIN